MDQIALGLVWYVVLLFSLTFHEAAHAWAAKRGGDETAYRGGQASLDPIPHVRREPFGTIFVPILSFVMSGWMIGWASTPYDPAWANDHPRRAGWMALAGPSANLLLVALAALAIRAGMVAELLVPPDVIRFTEVTAATGPGFASAVAVFLSILFTLNLLLFVFNLIPLPPLDGAGVLNVLLPEAAARRLQFAFQQPQLALFGIVVAWFAIRPIFGPVHLVAVNLLYPEYGYGRG